MPSIETRGLTKEFGDLVAVADLDLTVEDGEVFGFLGPNGAGKSTTINLLLDFLRPTRGSVSVLGMDVQAEPAAIRRRVGVLPEGYGFADHVLGREYVEWAIASNDADDDPDELLAQVGLTDAGDRPATSYSTGMSQRLAFAMALVGDPDLLILDEPSSGLDPNGMATLRELVRERAENGTTVFFSSHILSEVEAVCDRVGVMNEGRLVAVDSIEGLRDTLGGTANISLECASAPGDLGLASLDGVLEVVLEDSTVTATCRTPGTKVDVVTHAAGQVEIRDIRSAGASLEELFADLTESDGGQKPGDSQGAPGSAREQSTHQTTAPSEGQP